MSDVPTNASERKRAGFRCTDDPAIAAIVMRAGSTYRTIAVGVRSN